MFTLEINGVISLPVELTYFNAKRKEDKVNLHWQTASEINNDYFTIERSFNGNEFEPISIVDGVAIPTEPLTILQRIKLIIKVISIIGSDKPTSMALGYSNIVIVEAQI